jgi:DNA-binding MarR family transcriptional regulator
MAPGLSELPDTERASLADLAPSAKLVALVLTERGRMTQQQLAEATLLSTRTTRHALSELEDAGVVTSRTCFMDARQRLYSLDGDAGGDAAGERLLTAE